MRYLICLFSLVVAVALAGCASHSEDYIKQSKVVRPIVVPQGVAVKPGQNYYAVPLGRTQTVTTSPSLVPPGSNPQRFRHVPAKPQAQQNNKTLASWMRTENGQALEIAENAKTAWAHVGQALRATNYKILDRDSAMGSYYVLDTSSTDNKITSSTPIYRILLTAEGKNTQIQLLNQRNQPAPNDVSQRILGAVQQKLIKVS